MKPLKVPGGVFKEHADASVNCGFNARQVAGFRRRKRRRRRRRRRRAAAAGAEQLRLQFREQNVNRRVVVPIATPF